jgi:flagellar basal-body rod protein FlgG
MIRSLWIAKTGMDAQQMNLDVISNNLANSATTAYKKVQPLFQDLLYTTIRSAGSAANAQNLLPTGLQIGAGSAITSTERTNTQGGLVKTNNPLDIAIQGNGFFQIQLADGTTAYTRNGQFSRSATGQIVTSSGNTVSPGLTIPIAAGTVTIGVSGIVSATDSTTGIVTQVGQLSMANFINPAGLVALGAGNYIASPASGSATNGLPGQNGLGTMNQYYIEQSNVNVAEELVNLIAAQRAYEINVRAVTASDQILQRVSNMGQ